VIYIIKIPHSRNVRTSFREAKHFLLFHLKCLTSMGLHTGFCLRYERVLFNILLFVLKSMKDICVGCQKFNSLLYSICAFQPVVIGVINIYIYIYIF
jgi:hypothetical protein